ncbi:MAG: deoxynucleoside kinase, partial [Calditrichia bacterium]|nr:deoxynucleoside kinase [Calditrichia bacterium]
MDEIIKKVKQKYFHIVVEGVIGAGKTTVASYLSEQLNAGLVLEKFEKNPYLEKFYRNPEKYALPVQTFFLNERYKQQLLLKKRILDGETIVSDYAFFKNKIFASVNLKKFDYHLFSIDEKKKNRKLIIKYKVFLPTSDRGPGQA